MATGTRQYRDYMGGGLVDVLDVFTERSAVDVDYSGRLQRAQIDNQ